nr:erlin-2-B-like [Physcomitrium patens]PNR60964.1 hypothetical protein PHYPA_003757 [Physcomitrium patens]|eukprot:XP_024400601.1 erlin-2-B-like [Physcomitrella patens]
MDGSRRFSEGAPRAPTRPSDSPSPPILFAICAIGLAILVPLAVAGTNLVLLHQIPEGHVGVYWRGGALLNTISEPGFHLMIPFLTRVEPIQVTIQTDQVMNIPCGTKGGVMLEFAKIEVVNRLKKNNVYETILNFGVQYDKTWIYDKIHHEINQFCSCHTLQEVYIDKFDQIDEMMKEAIQRDCTLYAPGIEIIGVRVTKPTIPLSIARNYEIMEEERTKVLIAVEKQKLAEKEAETIKKRAVTDAEKNAKVSEIQMTQRLREKESIKTQQEIENEIFLAKEKSLADANFYRVMKEAKANELKLTPEFLELKFIEAVANNTKMFFGEKLPNMVLDQRLLGNYFGSENQKQVS